ncbi:MAG: excinuclease ABC subunit UvrA [Planctomycetaceae bacterium]
MSDSAPSSKPPAGDIRVRGARVHNLRGVDVDIPRQRLTVITGVSGSGKSSLAFDVIHAESQRRYLESLSAETRARVGAWQRPDVDVIDGLPPTISVGQSARSASLRSTLATTTEILDYLRLLFARCGEAHCPQCDRPLAARSPQEIVEQILALEEGRKVMILAPLVRGKRGTHHEAFEIIAKAGFVRARVNGELIEASQPPKLAKTKSHTIEAIVDRIVVKAGLQARLRESVELALKHGDGTVVLSQQTADGWEDHAYCSRFACADCGVSFAELEPRTFSFNSPHGACLSCRGLGVVVTDETDFDAISAQQSERHELCPDCHGSRLNPFARGVRFRELTLPELLGKTVSETAEIIAAWENTIGEPQGASRGSIQQGVNLGAIDAQNRRLAPCRSDETGPLSVSSSTALIRILERTLPAIRQRLVFLIRVGADYLSLDRPARTLSGGEFQRARLAACLGSGLVGACYVLDEPTVGLHPKDTAAMIGTLHELRDQGNTVLIVEHDPDVMRSADYLIDLGPGAGADGGQVIACGSPSDVANNAQSVTGPFLQCNRRAGGVSPARLLSGTALAAGLAVTIDTTRPATSAMPLKDWLTLSDISVHNLRDVSVRIPLGALTAITGVSGSGKTSLVHHALVPQVRQQITRSVSEGSPPVTRSVSEGSEPVTRSVSEGSPPVTRSVSEGSKPDQRSTPSLTLRVSEETIGVTRLVEVTQSPLGRTATSNPATYSGVWDDICHLFAQTREAKLRGFRASRFRFNSPAGRCEACRGRGAQRVRLQLLPDVFVTCPTCRGERFNAATLQVRFHGLTAADVLRLRIDEAAETFANISRVAGVLKTFREVGLGYLRLGQSATTLSGGEAQRVKLATELSRETTAATLFVLDEPTTGLHPLDVERLIALLRRLVESGHTVVVIEHHLDVIAQADWLIDLGPDGGSRGGRIVAQGSPADVAAQGRGHTAQALNRSAASGWHS